SAGSTVFAEAPSYIKSLQVFQSAGMRLSGVPMDDQGLRADALERALGEYRAVSGKGADAVLYTIPTNHNPTG
ncbi:PLP-dependent aminotransferase family protein, partial [Bifidobacterium animalis]|nr:PLP-dependent aminotransferase family protein [Bifidobacterium animalis]